MKSEAEVREDIKLIKIDINEIRKEYDEGDKNVLTAIDFKYKIMAHEATLRVLKWVIGE